METRGGEKKCWCPCCLFGFWLLSSVTLLLGTYKYTNSYYDKCKNKKKWNLGSYILWTHHFFFHSFFLFYSFIYLFIYFFKVFYWIMSQLIFHPTNHNIHLNLCLYNDLLLSFSALCLFIFIFIFSIFILFLSIFIYFFFFNVKIH